MTTAIEELVSRMQVLEEELQNELTRKRLEIEFAIEKRRIRFPPKVLRHQMLHRVGVWCYLREVAARAEQSRCPIKHARRLLGVHERYPQFFESGDAHAFRPGLDRLQRQYDDAAGAPPAG